MLIDFGLARVAEDPRLTQTGCLLGTPGYLAPEILYGDDATAASDVHAWAATVVFAATGRAPYGSGPAMAIMDRVRRGEHDLSGVPDPLRELLASCLRPEPLERPTLHELRAWLARPRGGRRGRARSRPTVRALDDAVLPGAHAARPPDRGRAARDAAIAPPGAPAGARALRRCPRPLRVPSAPRPPADPRTRVIPASSPGPAPGPTPSGTAATPAGTQRVLQLLGLGAADRRDGRLRAVRRHRARRPRRPAPAHRLGHPPAARAAPAGPRPRPVVRRADHHGLAAGVRSCSRCSARCCWSWARRCRAGHVLAGLPARPAGGDCLVLAGLGFTATLWWGPGSGRLREMTRGLVDPLRAHRVRRLVRGRR